MMMNVADIILIEWMITIENWPKSSSSLLCAITMSILQTPAIIILKNVKVIVMVVGQFFSIFISDCFYMLHSIKNNFYFFELIYI